jgi:hypothetical protein
MKSTLIFEFINAKSRVPQFQAALAGRTALHGRASPHRSVSDLIRIYSQFPYKVKKGN